MIVSNKPKHVAMFFQIVYIINLCWTDIIPLLTLRLLMPYIYIYMEHPFLMFLDHIQRRSTIDRTPLDE